ncbi:MAG TPA: helix-hairpin-helix domain-containing protein [Acidimicrobiales bacterium]|nr:helix-hairpin-helix domain-containing protein [Acidimicrobiales bacterium]
MADLLQPLPLRSWADRVAALRRSPRLRPVLAVGGAVVAVAVLLAVGMAFLRSSSPPPGLTLPKAEPGSAPAADPATPASAGSTADPVPPTTPVTVTVHVAGEVLHPGVYAVAAGGRVADAIQVAGGTTADADAEQLNLAARVADGERIYVPKRGEAAPPVLGGAGDPQPAGAGGPAAPVDLNTATAAELEALPGVGPATSKAILAYRSAHGRFRSVTELLEVPGIGPAKLEALRPLVRV